MKIDKDYHILIPENKKEAKEIVKIREREIRNSNGLFKLKLMEPKSFVEMVMAQIYAKLLN